MLIFARILFSRASRSHLRLHPLNNPRIFSTLCAAAAAYMLPVCHLQTKKKRARALGSKQVNARRRLQGRRGRADEAPAADGGNEAEATAEGEEVAAA